ncbi:hypothetical protein [Kitasatospora sp. NPDC058190]
MFKTEARFVKFVVAVSLAVGAFLALGGTAAPDTVNTAAPVALADSAWG